MSEFSEPKKETVRITLPPPPRVRPPGGEGSPNETVRISSPEGPAATQPIQGPSSHAPTLPPLRPPPSPPRPPARPPLAKEPANTSAAPPAARPPAPVPSALPPRPRVLPPPPRVQAIPPAAPLPAASDSIAGPKKETARISILPEATTPARAVKMTKTQPLQMTPPQQAPAARVQVAQVPAPVTAPQNDAVPMPLVWAAFVISAITLLIQIWNYFAS